MKIEEKAQWISYEIISRSKSNSDIDKIVRHINNLKYKDQTYISDKDRDYVIDKIISALEIYKEKLESNAMNLGATDYSAREISRIKSITAYFKKISRKVVSTK